MKLGIQGNICTPVFIAALFTIAQKWKKPKSADRRVDKQNRVYVQTMGTLLSVKMEEILSCATIRINPEDIMLSEVSQSQKYCMILLICDTSEQSNSWRQKVERWFLGAGEKGKESYCLTGSEFQCCKIK